MLTNDLDDKTINQIVATNMAIIKFSQSCYCFDNCPELGRTKLIVVSKPEISNNDLFEALNNAVILRPDKFIMCNHRFCEFFQDITIKQEYTQHCSTFEVFLGS